MAIEKKTHQNQAFPCFLPLIILLICLIGPNLTSAATYYLNAVDGNDFINTGSGEQPWQTMAKVESSSNSGDTIIIRNMDESITTINWPSGRLYQAQTISQFGITWTFDEDYRIGQFANRDMWAVGPVTIIGIYPLSTEIAGRVKNGSMINPSPDISVGYDNQASYASGMYDHRLNVAFQVNDTNPLVITSDCSLISTISFDEGGLWPQLRTAAILTVLSNIPPANSFRPAYCGDDKTIRFKVSDLDYSILSELPPVASAPSLAALERKVQRPWLDHTTGPYHGRFQPKDNMKSYGRDIADEVGQVSLGLHLDWGEDNNVLKRDLYVGFVQVGIDLYGAVKNGMTWESDGGIFCGRKWPILFAGLALNENSDDDWASEMANIGNVSEASFQEDMDTHYTDESHIYSKPFTLYPARVDLVYDSGSVTITADDPYTIHGVGTSWTAEGWVKVLPGYWFGVENDSRTNDVNGHCYQIDEVDYDAQTLTLKVPFSDSEPEAYEDAPKTEVAYKIAPSLVVGHGSPDKLPSTSLLADYKEFVPADIGLPIWYLLRRIPPRYINAAPQTTKIYEALNASAWQGFVLAALITDAKEAWNHEELFDYEDRFMQEALEIYGEGAYQRGWSDFCEDMWDTYRTDYGPVWPDNRTLVANAGPDQTVYEINNDGSELVILDGGASTDSKGTIISYNWWKNGVRLASGVNPSIILGAGTHTIDLVVTNDSGEMMGLDSLTVTVVTNDRTPPAITNVQATAITETAATITWTTNENATSQVEYGLTSGYGSVTNLDDSLVTSHSVGLSGLSAGASYHYRVRSKDAAGNEKIGSDYTFTTDSGAAPVNQPPTANAGADQTLSDSDNTGSEDVSLDGSRSSDPDGNISSYQWSEGATQYPSGSTPTITLAVGVHIITLTVTDNDGLTATDTVTITVNGPAPANQAPVAEAGSAQTLTDSDKNGTELVTLNASGSFDPDGSIASYAWSEAGNTIAAGQTAQVTLSTGVHTITLTVTDNGGLTAADTVIMTITTPANQAPVAEAGSAQTLTDSDKNGTELVTLNASGSFDPDGSIASYTWSEAGNVIATGETTQVTLSTGVHTITLTVTDDQGLTATDTANITIQAPTYTITATAGAGGSIVPAAEVTVNDGLSQTFTITPNTDYEIADVIVDGVSQGAMSSYPFDNVTSNHTIAAVFTTQDETAPKVTNASPSQDDIQAPLNTLITLHVGDSGSGVDINSVAITIEGNIVYTGGSTDYVSAFGRCQWKGTQADYIFTYQSAAVFDLDQTVNVAVSARDLAGNTMPKYSYSFKTQMRSFGGNTQANADGSDLPDSSPVTVSDSLGNIWAAWETGLLGRRSVYIAKRPAGSRYYENPVRITNSPYDQCNPTIAIDKNGKLYLAWQENPKHNWDIYFATSTDGTNWSKATKIANTNANQINPVIAVEPYAPNVIYVAWQDDRKGNYDIYIVSSSDDFASKQISPIATVSADQTEPAIALDSYNNVYVVWTDTRNGSNDIYGAASNNGPWTNVPIVMNNYNQSSPALAVEDQGDILHLLWVDDTPGNNDIYYGATSGSLPDQPLTGISIVDDSANADQSSPTIAVSGSVGDNLKIFAGWQDERNVLQDNGDIDIYFAETASDYSFGTNIWVSDNDATNSGQLDPQIALDAKGNPYLLWIDTTGGDSDIHYVGTTITNAELLYSQNIVASQGGIVGTNPDNITTVDDVSLEIPAGAFWTDVEITIHRVDNPPASIPPMPLDILSAIEYGPSSDLEFAKPVTITIPYAVSETDDPSIFWFNTNTGQFSQSAILNVEHIVISPTLHAIRYNTTHFTQYTVALPIHQAQSR